MSASHLRHNNVKKPSPLSQTSRTEGSLTFGEYLYKSLRVPCKSQRAILNKSDTKQTWATANNIEFSYRDFTYKEPKSFFDNYFQPFNEDDRKRLETIIDPPDCALGILERDILEYFERTLQDPVSEMYPQLHHENNQTLPFNPPTGFPKDMVLNIASYNLNIESPIVSSTVLRPAGGVRADQWNKTDPDGLATDTESQGREMIGSVRRHYEYMAVSKTPLSMLFDGIHAVFMLDPTGMITNMPDIRESRGRPTFVTTVIEAGPAELTYGMTIRLAYYHMQRHGLERLLSNWVPLG